MTRTLFGRVTVVKATTGYVCRWKAKQSSSTSILVFSRSVGRSVKWMYWQEKIYTFQS